MKALTEPIEYRGYTIQMDSTNNPYGKPQFMYYPTDEGISHDADCDGEDFRYCGNCRWADTLEDAIDEIYEIVQPEIK